MSRPESYGSGIGSGEGWIDVSRPLRAATPVWPGDRSFEITQRREERFVISSFATTCHIGTHLDAPLHLDPTADGVEHVPLARCVGVAEVVRVSSAGTALTARDFPSGWSPGHPKMLIRTDSYPLDAEIDRGITGLSAELVHWLADRGVETLGIDTPSVDSGESEELEAHRALLARKMTWIEGLWLADVNPGSYLMIALPILLEGAEAAPVRAILKRVSSHA
ncbi:MAG: cyclase family protein [Thermoanaerobaculales bacterium]